MPENNDQKSNNVRRNAPIGNNDGFSGERDDRFGLLEKELRSRREEVPGGGREAGMAWNALATLADNVDLAFLTIGRTGSVTYANRMAAEFFNRPGGTLEGARLFDLMKGIVQDLPGLDSIYSRIALDSRPDEVELPVHKFRWAIFHVYPIGGGKAIVIEDITHRRIRDEPMRAALLTFNSLPEAVFLLFQNDRVYYANDAACNYTGYTMDELRATPPNRIIPDLVPELLERYGSPVPGGINFESLLRNKSGAEIPVEVRISVRKLFHRTNYIVSVRDITERKKAEKALRESEERFRALVTASSELLYHMSPDWGEMYQLHSQGFLANTERPNRNWLQEYIPGDEQPRVLAAIREAIRTKSMFELEHRVIRADGSIGWTHSRAVPILDPKGEIVEWFGAANDITEAKRDGRASRTT